MKNRIIDTDVLIIGGGTAGCFAGITLGKKKDLDVLIVEKANIVRSGCLAAGEWLSEDSQRLLPGGFV